MKCKFLCLLFFVIINGFLLSALRAQDTTYNRQFRLSIDDDFINLRGKGTDEAYTAGTNFSLFYDKHHTSRFFLDRWMPRAGPQAINTFGWGIAQLIYTPRDINRVPPDPDDYRYAGALIAVHSLYSYNPDKNYSFQTEIVGGVMGPPSLAEEAQKFFHSVIGYRSPAGWNYQLPTDALLNVNITAEELFFKYGKLAEITGVARLAAGTMEDGLTIYGKIRAGIMNPYFNGFMQQHSSLAIKRRLQVYAFIEPGAEVLGYYALIERGLFNNKPSYYDNKHTRAPDNRKLIGHVDGGLIFSSGKVAVSVSEKIATSMLKDVRAHSVGNVSFYIAW